MVASVVVSAAVLTSAFAQMSYAVPYVDPAGDSGGDLDITLVSVDTDRTSGTITFAVTVTGFDPASWDGQTRSISVLIDADMNRSTGGGGFEFKLFAWTGPQVLRSTFDRWNGTTFQIVPTSPSMSFSRSGNVLTWVFNKAEVGTTGGFDFWLNTAIHPGNGTVNVRDRAPDDAGIGLWWRYTMDTEPAVPRPAPAPQPVVVRPVFGSARTVPAKPVAGKKLVFTLAVNRSNTGAPLTAGKMICDPSVAGKVIRHVESFTGGKARLTFVVPKTANGKLLKVKVTIKNGAQSATKVVAFKVR